jgi:secreted trypsin-like serine protease
LPDFQKNLRDLLDRAAQEESKLAPIAPGLRVVGGRKANKDEFPDCVCIGSRSDDGDEYCCTGTLIGKNVVVTAGHCLPCTGDSSVIYIGINTRSPGITYTGKAIQHPQYAQGGLHNDLTVILLDKDVTEVQPRRVATTDQVNQATFVRVVGFGNSDVSSTTGFGVKRIADVPVASISCSGATDARTLGCDARLELVAGMVGLKRDSCNGDSGGPIYVQIGDDPAKSESWAVAGATSRATQTAVTACGDGGIYERLDQFLDSFIRTIPGAHF